MARSTWIVLLAVALAIRLAGLPWGLPNAEHAQTYDPDEWTPLGCLARMEPRRLDFNPHYFDNPTLVYYAYGAGIGVAHGLGLLVATGGEKFYYEHPEHVARMVLVGRLFSVLLGTATVWLVYLLARRLGGSRTTAGLAALLLAVHPSHVVHSHFMTVNAPVAFGTVLSLLALERWMRKDEWRVLFGTALVLGLTFSTKYNAFLLLPAVLVAGALRTRARMAHPAGRGSRAALRAGVVETSGLVLVSLVVFVLGSPYLVLAYDEAARLLGRMASTMRTPEAGSPGEVLWLAFITPLVHHLWASTPPLVVAAGAGLLHLKAATPARLVVLTFALTFAAATLRMGHLATDSRFMPIFPLLCMFAATALTALVARHRRLGLAVTALVVLVSAGWALVLAERFVGPMPQALASRWIAHNVPPDARLWAAGSGLYFSPDLVRRELLHSENAGLYERRTAWRIDSENRRAQFSMEAGRAFAPDVVVLTLLPPSLPAHSAWLREPGYEVVASFPGKVRLFGRRVPVPLDIYDVDIWVLRRSAASPAAP